HRDVLVRVEAEHVRVDGPAHPLPLLRRLFRVLQERDHDEHAPALRTRAHWTPFRWYRSAHCRADSSTVFAVSANGLASTRSAKLSFRISSGLRRRITDRTMHTTGST